MSTVAPSPWHRALPNWVEWLVVGATLSAFLVAKLTTLTTRYGDANTYLYMADQWLQGSWPYQDYFFADFPVLLYVLTAFVAIWGPWVWGYYALPVIFEAVAAGLLYLIARKHTPRLAFLAPLIYLFSFSTLATVDYPTGLQLVCMFLVGGWLAFEHKHYRWAGALFVLATMTKMYAAPGLMGLGVYLIATRQFQTIWKLAQGGLAAAMLVMLPVISVFVPHGLDATIIHHFNRPDGVEKPLLFSFYFQREWLLLLLGTLGALLLRKRLALGWMLSGWVLFFLIFRDLYYLYLHVMSWVLVLLALTSLGFLKTWIKKRLAISSVDTLLLSMLVTLSLAWLLAGVMTYVDTTQAEGRWMNSQSVVEFLENAPPGPLYGTHEAVPLLALQTGRPILNNVIDSNAQTFGSGVHDKRELAEALVAESGILVARISRYPEFGIADQGFERYFDREVFDAHCAELRSFPSTDRGIANLLVLYHCR